MHVPNTIGGAARKCITLRPLLIVIRHIKQAPISIAGQPWELILQPVGVVFFADAAETAWPIDVQRVKADGERSLARRAQSIVQRFDIGENPVGVFLG